MKKCIFPIIALLFSIGHSQTPSIKEQPRIEKDSAKSDIPQNEIEAMQKAFNDSTYSPELTELMKSEPAPYLKYYENILSQVNDDIKKIRKASLELGKSKKNIDNNTKIIDSLKVSRGKLRKLNTKLSKQKNNYKKLFPTLTSNIDIYNNFFNELYDKDKNQDLYLINNTSYQFGGGGSIVRSELVSAYLKGLRISLGTVVTTSNENDVQDNVEEEEMTPEPNKDIATDESEAFKRLASGGSTYLDFELPITLVQGNAWTFYWSANTRLNLAINGFSNDLENTLFNSNIGSRIYSSVSSDDKKFVFYFAVNAGLYFGEKDFYESLSVPDKGFLFGQLQVGVSVLQNLKLTFDISSFSSEDSLNSGRVIVGAQLLTDFFKKSKN